MIQRNNEKITFVDDLMAFIEMHKGWVNNPLLVSNEEMAEKVRTICKENNISIKVEVAKAKWKKK